ncbi:MAG: lipopolysaccharide assembly protein LapB [Cycloclasticus sp.]|nr:lipopolysaccharide assembly protein LapB [Cycloclasticus sp.]
MFEIAIMLLPIAAASGWYFAYRHYRRATKNTAGDHGGYFKGLNYLLNEQPDKAIGVFIDLLEVDHETIEIHLALGTLFRQRGEVEKAIRLHQNLMARPQIDQETRLNVLNELGLDYMRAGLLDRAESIFIELEKNVSHKVQASKQLLSIFQQEKEWQQAITFAVKLESINVERQPVLLSHLHCEVAIENSGNKSVLNEQLKKALKIDQGCVRANVIAAQEAMKSKDYKLALKIWLKIENQDIRFIPVFLNPILSCFDELNKPAKKFDFLANLQTNTQSSIVLKQFIEALLATKGRGEVIAFLREKLQQTAKLSYLKLYANIDEGNDLSGEVAFLQDTIKQLDDERLSFNCIHCGFSSNELNWCCPSCKKWGTTQPMLT